ncbi:MAG: response regulator transcription factor [Verrucomicrobia bacterium]|nr:response regulator transcription factor [Cytophagales bacterium]
MIKTFLIDDHPMIIEGIRSLLIHSGNIEVIGSAVNAFLAIEFLKSQPADVILLDISLPEIDGIELCKKIKTEYPDSKILGISTFKERSYISKMLENGASGYVLKSVSQTELIEAITAVFNGKIYLNEEITRIFIQDKSENKILPLLTRREKEVLVCIADGLTNPEIAEKLFVSPLTIDSHRKNLLAKFEAKNTASLVKIAIENQLI